MSTRTRDLVPASRNWTTCAVVGLCTRFGSGLVATVSALIFLPDLNALFFTFAYSASRTGVQPGGRNLRLAEPQPRRVRFII